MEVGALLERRSAGLEVADTLRVDQHLEGCESCRQAARFLDTFAVLSGSVPKLDEKRSERALLAALASLDHARAQSHKKERSPRNLSRQLLAFGTSAALSIGVIFVIFAMERHDRRLSPAPPALTGPGASANANQGRAAASSASPLQVSTPLPKLPDSGRAELSEGRLLGPKGELRPGEQLAFYERYQVGELPAKLQLEDAELILSTGARLRWHPELRTIVLESGQAQLEVKAGSRRGLRIEAPTYSLLALDASVVLNPHGLQVQRGELELSTRSGEHLLGLSEGSSWNADSLPEASRPSALALELEALPPAQAATRLSRALSEPAQAEANPTACERSALTLLLAKTQLRQGQSALATEAYESLAGITSCPGSAELSLFAAAFLTRGPAPLKAHGLFAAYLTRFPYGVFDDEVRRHLATLDGEG